MSAWLQLRDFPALSLTAIPWLTLLLGLPLLGALLVWCWPRRALRLARGLSSLCLIISLVVVVGFDPRQTGFQLIDAADWLPGIKAGYLVGIDGLSLWFLPATALIFFALFWLESDAPAATPGNSADGGPGHGAARPQPSRWLAMLLLLQGNLFGVFCALDTLLLFTFWELSALPLYFLVSHWGQGEVRETAALRTLLLMLGSGIALLLGLLVLGSATATALDLPGLVFDLPRLLSVSLSRDTQRLAFALLLLGLAVKIPLLPLHSWLPGLALAAPAPLMASLLGIKLGLYALIRLAIPLAPAAAQEWHWLLAGLGTAGLLYGSVAALGQTNLRVIFAYLGMAHAGLGVLALSSFSVAALQGCILLALGLTLSSGGLYLVLEMLYRRCGSLDLHALGGLASSMPRLVTLLLILAFLGLGLPGSINFVAEFTILLAVLPQHAGASLAALFALILAAAAALGPCQRLAFGPARTATPGPDLDRREALLATLLVLLTLGFGLFPDLLLGYMASSSEHWVARLPAH